MWPGLGGQRGLGRRDLDGTPQWGVALERPPDADNYAADLVVSPDGTTAVVATTYGDLLGDGQRMQAFDPDGLPLWPASVFVSSDTTTDRPSLGLDAGCEDGVGGGVWVRRYLP